MSKAWPPVSFLWQVGVSVGLLMRWWLGRAAGQTGGGSQECNAGTVWSSGHTWALQSWCLFPCDFGQAYWGSPLHISEMRPLLLGAFWVQKAECICVYNAPFWFPCCDIYHRNCLTGQSWFWFPALEELVHGHLVLLLWACNKAERPDWNHVAEQSNIPSWWTGSRVERRTNTRHVLQRYTTVTYDPSAVQLINQ